MLQPDLFKKAEVKGDIPTLIYEKDKILEADSSNMTPTERGNKLSEYLKKARISYIYNKESYQYDKISRVDYILKKKNRLLIGKVILNNPYS
jgi:hypothetical protein